MKHTPDNLTFLAPNEIFVFGSNTKGVHGKGAALHAKRAFGAINGQPEGLQGQSYAIPTREFSRSGVYPKLKTLPLSAIREYVNEFLRFAELNPHLRFYVTKIGCGNAGYNFEQIAPMFRDAPKNVSIPAEFDLNE